MVSIIFLETYKYQFSEKIQYLYLTDKNTM